MKRTSDCICSQCDLPGFRFRGERWLCEIHHRIDCMRTCARHTGKYVPTNQELESLFEKLISDGMRCPHCKQSVVLSGKPGQLNVVSLQHNRDGEIQFLCKLCNSRHDDFPGDTFYDTPIGHKYCWGCNQTLPPEDFWLMYTGRPKLQGKCKECKRVENKKWWDRQRTQA